MDQFKVFQRPAASKFMKAIPGWYSKVTVCLAIRFSLRLLRETPVTPVGTATKTLDTRGARTTISKYCSDDLILRDLRSISHPLQPRGSEGGGVEAIG